MQVGDAGAALLVVGRGRTDDAAGKALERGVCEPRGVAELCVCLCELAVVE
jgi:hypothetical protein